MKQSGSKKPAARKTSNRPAAKKISPIKKVAPNRSATGSGGKAKTHGGNSGATPSVRAGTKFAAAKQGKAPMGNVSKRPAAPVILKREPTAEEISHKKNLAQFENGLKLFNHGDHAKAREIFETLATVPSADLAQRAQIYVNICKQRLTRPAPRLKTAEDFYNYAVSMANQGNREEAENNLSKALKLEPNADYIVYALATTQALRGNVEGALESLQKAIGLNGKNRYLAQNDADFEGLGEDPRFTELLYPEKPVS